MHPVVVRVVIKLMEAPERRTRICGGDMFGAENFIFYFGVRYAKFA